jgi:hypothetical protein
MSATVEIDEQNGNSSSPTLTHNISNSNMGSTDSANLNPLTYPIVPGQNSYEKWQLLHVTDMGTSTKINNIQVWRTGDMGANALHLTNARTNGYGGAAIYTTPTSANSSVATETMPTSSPGSANLGIGGSLSGEITAPGYSDFLVHQIQTAKNALAGNITTMNYQYDETT